MRQDSPAPGRMTHTEQMGIRVAATVGAAAVAAGLAGCSAAPADNSQTVTGAPVAAPVATTALFSVPVDPGERASAVIRNGRILAAELVSRGQELPLAVKKERVFTQALVPGQTYRLSVETNGADGLRTWTKKWTVRAARGSETAGAWLTPDGGTYGVGMPVSLGFDAPVAKKKAVENTLDVLVDGKPGPGMWSWLDDQTVMYRGRDFWPADSKIRVTADLAGVRLSQSQWGDSDLGVTWRTGRRMVVDVDLVDHSYQVDRDGKTIRTGESAAAGPASAHDRASRW